MIILTNVSKSFGAQLAVNDVSFSAGSGITGFLGPNGAGKSTTMRMITGYLEPSAGRIEINGAPAWPSEPSVRSRIGYLPEHNPLYTDMYVREYLGFVAGVHRLRDPARRVAEVVELVGLRLEQRKKINQLSKGYRQRVGLAQALIHDPAILILDEPTSGLDPNQLAEIRGVIRHLGESKIVLLSTHIMQEVQALCERVLIIDRGGLVADDSIGTLRDRLAGQVSVRVVCVKPIAAAELARLPGVVRVDAEGNTARVWVAPDLELRPQLAERCLRSGWGLLELHRDEASVEDVFQLLTRETARA